MFRKSIIENEKALVLINNFCLFNDEFTGDLILQKAKILMKIAESYENMERADVMMEYCTIVIDMDMLEDKEILA